MYTYMHTYMHMYMHMYIYNHIVQYSMYMKNNFFPALKTLHTKSYRSVKHVVE